MICHKLSHNYLAHLDIMILLSNLLIFCHVKNYQSVKYTFVMLNIHILLYTFTLLLKKNTDWIETRTICNKLSLSLIGPHKGHFFFEPLKDDPRWNLLF